MAGVHELRAQLHLRRDLLEQAPVWMLPINDFQTFGSDSMTARQVNGERPMGTKLSPHDAELYQRVGEVLHYIWDPIGVAGMSMARDEYYSYLPPTVFSLLTQGDSNDEKTAEYLIMSLRTGLGLHETKEHAYEIVDVLQDLNQTLNEKYAQTP